MERILVVFLCRWKMIICCLIIMFAFFFFPWVKFDNKFVIIARILP